jgi:hypothetical protein
MSAEMHAGRIEQVMLKFVVAIQTDIIQGSATLRAYIGAVDAIAAVLARKMALHTLMRQMQRLLPRDAVEVLIQSQFTKSSVFVFAEAQ